MELRKIYVHSGTNANAVFKEARAHVTYTGEAKEIGVSKAPSEGIVQPKYLGERSR